MKRMDRLLRVRQIMREQGLSQLIVTQPQSIYYLTGCWVNPMDRLDALVIRESELCFLCYVLAVAYPENAKTVIYDDMGQAIPELCRLLEAVPTGVDEEMPARYALALQQAMPALNIRPAACVELARMCKDEEEIRRLEYASQVTDLVFQEAFPQLREGMTEIEFGQVDVYKRQAYRCAEPHADRILLLGRNTRGIAEEIQRQTGFDLFAIECETPYSDDYETVLEQAQADQNAQARPALANHVPDMAQYGTIILGYPNWWASIPGQSLTK